jgi:hypothetical protein
MSSDAASCHCGAKKSPVCLVKKIVCKIRGNFKSSVLSSPKISYVSCCDPCPEKWKRYCVYGWKIRQKWLSVSGAVMREKAMAIKAGFRTT